MGRGTPPPVALTSPYGRYLLAKRTVDDRALNQHVLARLRAELAPQAGARLRVLEIGAGLGTMVARAIDWGVLRRGHWLLLDEDAQLIAEARAWLAGQAAASGHGCRATADGLRLTSAGGLDLEVAFLHAELGAFLDGSDRPPAADLLVANAFLDLVHVPTTLPRLFDLLAPRGLFWFTVNFDGDTILEPPLADDEHLLRVYHRSMDGRVRHGRPAGDSRSGRHLFTHLREAGATLLAAGSSDWVVYPQCGAYPDDEATFLRGIVDTIDAELRQHDEIATDCLARWTAERRAQIGRGELVYIAHQLDFVGRRP
jgi:SAM-dependent methyltransferase